MDSKSIGNVTSAAPTAQPQARVQQSEATPADKSDRAAAARRQQATEQAQAEVKIPQRDPRSLQYQVDGATHRVVATIVDEGSKTVVRQIPDAEILRIAQAIDRMQGFLVEEKA
jgi:flagellar protein FlaG